MRNGDEHRGSAQQLGKYYGGNLAAKGHNGMTCITLVRQKSVCENPSCVINRRGRRPIRYHAQDGGDDCPSVSITVSHH